MLLAHLELPTSTHQLLNTINPLPGYFKFITAGSCRVQFVLWRQRSWATFHWNHSTHSSTDNATDLHSESRGFGEKILIILFACTFLKFSFDSTVTWHFKHTLKWKLSARHLGTRICWLLMDICFRLFFTEHWRYWCREKTGNSCGTFLKDKLWLTSFAVGSIPPNFF